MPEQTESEFFLVMDLPWLLCDGDRQQCIRWTNGNWFALDIWWH